MNHSRIFFKCSFKDIDILIEREKTEDDKINLMNKIISGNQLKTETGFKLSDDIFAKSVDHINYINKLKKEVKKLEFKKNSKTKIKYFKMIWKGSELCLEGIFKDLQSKGYVKEYSKELINNHFKLESLSGSKLELIPKIDEKVIWLNGPTSLMYFLYCLFEKKLIKILIKKLHYLPRVHFLNEKNNEYELKNSWVILDQVTSRIDSISDKNKKLYDEIIDIIDKNI